MILVKRKHLYLLTLLFALIIVYGEIKFFFAVHNLNLTGDLSLKYDVENFIFAFILLVLVVYIFMWHVIRSSDDVLRRMDKLIEISSYGKYDIDQHLRKLGGLGEKVRYLILELNRLNRMKSLKISSMFGVMTFLMERINDKVIVFNRLGGVVDSSLTAAKTLGKERPEMMTLKFKDIFEGIDPEELFLDLGSKRKEIKRADILVRKVCPADKCGVTFYPVFNPEKLLSNVICVIE